MTPVNALAGQSSLRKMAGCDGCPDAGAITNQGIASGGAYVEFTVPDASLMFVAGLTHAFPATDSAYIDFGIRAQDGWVEVRENDVYQSSTTVIAGDAFRITVDASGVASYAKNGAAFYTSAASPTLPLVFAAALYSLNASLTGVALGVLSPPTTNAALLGARREGKLFSNLARADVPSRRRECVDLLSCLVREQLPAPDAAWRRGLRAFGASVIEALPKRLKRTAASDLDDDLHDARDVPRAIDSDAEMLVTLLDTLAAIDAPDLRRSACDAVAEAHSFDSARVIVAALSLMRARDRKTISADGDYKHVWHRAATLPLARSEHPPEAPKDWRQEGKSRAPAATAGSCRRSCSVRSSKRIAFACARIDDGICTSRSNAMVWT
jgi:hypothetical protein